ncbi:hypothetical protein PG993_003053 [Apiospora rasikravindrae]|uniref:Uncharacterized protein n=1 Tax=Apiospora rasikravindrae TaxID=990691 RepID=A0ABR1TYL2_9PEZI
MTSNTNSSQGTAGSQTRPEAVTNTQQSGESWPTWCSACQTVKAGEHTCEEPESATDEITKPDPVYRLRLSHENGTRRVDRERKEKS